VTLVQALAKGAKMDAVVRDATELGVARIVVATCAHSVRRGAERSDAARRWRRIAVEAARQCGRGDAPRVEAAKPLAALLPEYSPAATGCLGLCMDPTGEDSVGALLESSDPEDPVVAIVGPEGGLSADELGLARAEGYRIARLGPFVMRTETVCAAVLGAILAQGSR
jgi:16S rRNA (uracil1498-N3)-methyltransferase